MKRLIPVGAGVLALAGTVAVALGPNSSAEWGVDGTAGGVLSVQRGPAVAREQPAAGATQPVDAGESPPTTLGAEATAVAEPTPEPARTITPVPTKVAASTRTAVTVEPKSTPTSLATQVPASPPVLAEPTKEEPAATESSEPRLAYGESP